MSPFRRITAGEIASHLSWGTCASTNPHTSPKSFPSRLAVDFCLGFLLQTQARHKSTLPSPGLHTDPSLCSRPASPLCRGLGRRGYRWAGKRRASKGQMEGQSPREHGLGFTIWGTAPPCPPNSPHLWCYSFGHPKYVCPAKRAKGKGRNIPLAPQLSLKINSLGVEVTLPSSFWKASTV